jgi:hypothetical protein
VTNERLHSALTAPAFRLVSALGAQIAAAFADEAEPPSASAAIRRAGRTPRPLSGGPSGSGGSPPSGSANAPVRVMDGVKEDAYR